MKENNPNANMDLALGKVEKVGPAMPAFATPVARLVPTGWSWP